MTELLKENAPSSVGQILQTSRIQRGLTLEQVSKHLCISKRLLSYLEEDAQHLVCDVYTVGFVRLYAQYLKLNAQEILEAFKVQTNHHPKTPPLIFPAPLPGRGIPSYRILAICILVLMTIIIGWKWMDYYTAAPYSSLEVALPKNEPTKAVKIESPETPLPPIQETASTNPSLEESNTSLAKDTPITLESALSSVNLQITEKSWIEVKDSEGNIILNRLFQPGESFEFKNSEDLVLKTGNLKGTHLSSGNKVFPVSEESGEVGRNISLNPKKWLE